MRRTLTVALTGLALSCVVVAVLAAWRPWAPPVVPAEYRSLVVAAAKTCPRLDVHVLAAQLEQESHWNPLATSPAGGEGIAQFLPATWATYGVDGNKDGTKDVWNPADAIPSAARLDCALLADTSAISGDPTRLMLAAYNAGLGAVHRYHGVPPFSETRAYVEQIMDRSKVLQLG
jgi:soluble lytic murein transglycosylase-like protein